MTKKLKIRFVKLECALVAQQLEIVGFSFAQLKHIKVNQHIFRLDINTVWFKNENPFFPVAKQPFNDNSERDEYLNNVIKWISEELFMAGGKLEVGKECEVADFPCPEDNQWKKRKLLAILPKRIRFRYITEAISDNNCFCTWRYARPIDSCVQPKIDGDTYTWQMEVEDER